MPIAINRLAGNDKNVPQGLGV